MRDYSGISPELIEVSRELNLLRSHMIELEQKQRGMIFQAYHESGVQIIELAKVSGLSSSTIRSIVRNFMRC